MFAQKHGNEFLYSFNYPYFQENMILKPVLMIMLMFEFAYQFLGYYMIANFH